MNEILYVHVGRGKTGTSLFQNEIFPHLKELNYIGKSKNNYPKWLIEWHYLDDIKFEKEFPKIKNDLFKKVEKNKINLISSEAFSIYGDIYRQAKRIERVSPNSKIIITLRNPIDSIISFYKYSVKEDHFSKKLENMIDWGDSRTPYVFYKRTPVYIPDYYYDEIIELYKDIFGEDNVCVLKYEDIKVHPEIYFSQLFDFLGIKMNFNLINEVLKKQVNVSPSLKNVNKIRQRNIYLDILNNFPSSKIKEEDIKDINQVIISTELEEKIKYYLKGKCYGYY